MAKDRALPEPILASINQHVIETIKNDDFGVAEKLLHYSAVVISANEDVKAVAPEVVRRTAICRVHAGPKKPELMRSSEVGVDAAAKGVSHNLCGAQVLYDGEI